MLYLHRSARADQLVEPLGELLSAPLGDAMEREVVAVPTKGVERWLAQRLSRRLGARGSGDDGVCANIDFPTPAALVAAVTAAACAGEAAPRPERWYLERDPWAPERCTWPLTQIVDEHIASGDSYLWPLPQHLRAASPAEEGRWPRRFSTVRQLAEMFDRYGVYRPEMVLSWLEDRPGGRGASASVADLSEPDMAWQAALWRQLREKLACSSPAERSNAAPALIEAGPERLDLPERVSLFGLTRLPTSQLRVLKALAVHRDVHLFLLHPSGALWQKIAQVAGTSNKIVLRADDPTARLATNPLLRSWGRDSREMQLVLASEGLTGGEQRAVEAKAGTLLGLVQADIRADREPAGWAPQAEERRPLLARTDDSLRVHSCHGSARQVEVAREAVLHLLAKDQSLEPRDIIIMCPDIERFAPLVQASFGSAGLAGAPALRARLADRSLRETNPLLAVAADLLELAGSRVTAAEVLDFASRGPVSRRFGFDQHELSRIEQWIGSTGARWGLDADHRAPWRLQRVETGTWRAALDRLLLGVSMSPDSGVFGGALPFDDVPSGDINLAGRLAELLTRLRRALDALRGPQSATAWARALLEGCQMLALAPSDQSWQPEQLRSALEEAFPHEDAAPREVTLDVSEAKAWLSGRLRGRPTRANFRTGDMTICTLFPMRSVPHRVVCLLGLDDGRFPRPPDEAGDDLLLAAPRIGDRDATSEDRQLLLDALLAAEDYLIITFEGRDQHLNQRRPPSVPVAELLEVIDRTVRLEDGRPAREVIVSQHPLQPFDPANFTPGRLGVPGPWRFDTAQLEGAQALCGSRVEPPPFLQGPLDPLATPVVQLSSLVQFLEHPVRAFLRQRLGMYAGQLPDQLSGSLPVELAPLERWALGDRLLQARLAGATAGEACDVELGRGLLPPGPLGEVALAEVARVVDSLLAAAAKLTSWAPTSPGAQGRQARALEVSIPLPDGTLLVGNVPGVTGDTLLRCVYSKLGPKHRLRAWAHFLALSAARPEPRANAVTIGQSEGSSLGRPRVASVALPPLGATEQDIRAASTEGLACLVDLYRKGMREPLPIYCATSCAWASAAVAEESPWGPARARWVSSFDELPGEDADPEHVVVLGPSRPFLDLCAELPRPEETGPGWDCSQPNRLGRLAVKLWAPLIEHERPREH